MSAAGVRAGQVPTPRLAPGCATTSAAGVPGGERRAWVEHLMGMPVSVHARGDGARSVEVDEAVRAVFGELRRLDALFSTYRPESQVSRLQRGELAVEACDAEVQEVRRLCEVARVLTDGAFDAWLAVPGRPGVFDPTGLVKGWAVARAAQALDGVAEVAFAVGAGGDILLRPGAAGREWLIGIEDPRDRSRVLATAPVSDGAVATSGIAARGLHIVDPRTGLRATEVLSATVVGPSLVWADVFATAAVAHGRAAVEWVQGLHGTSGLLVLADGTVHRWSNPV